MAQDDAGFSWWNRELDDSNEQRGQFTLEDVQFFLRLLHKIDSHLLMSLPAVSFDFTGNGRGEVCIEIYDAEGMHIALVTLDQAEEITRRALLDWDARILRGKLCDLPIDWLCTSEPYA